MTSLWDRQAYALGEDSTSRIHNSNLLIEYDSSNPSSCSLLIELTKNFILLGFQSIRIVTKETMNIETTHVESYVKWENFRNEIHRLNPVANVVFSRTDEVMDCLDNFSCFVLCGISNSQLETHSLPTISVEVKGLIGRMHIGSNGCRLGHSSSFHPCCLLEGPIFQSLFEDKLNDSFKNWLEEYMNTLDEETLFDLFDKKSLSLENTDSFDIEDMKSQLIKFYLEKESQFKKSKDLSCYPMISLFSAFASNQILLQVLNLILNESVQSCWFYFEQLSLAPFLFQDNPLQDLNILVVGAGAIGCELVKNLMVLNACTRNGTLHVTDVDSIELTNLNRQFFFTKSDIGLGKSQVLKRMVQEFNPDMNIQSYEEKLSVESVSHLNSPNFWKSLDLVFGAVDNDQARQYLSERCLMNKIPFINAGTHEFYSQNSFHLQSETKPFQSENMKTEEELRNEIRTSCTLKSNPKRPEDLIMWSKMKYEDFFTDQCGSFFDMGRKITSNIQQELFGMAREMFNQMFVHPFEENEECDLESMSEDNMIQYFQDGNGVFKPRPVRLEFEKESHRSFLNGAMNLIHRHLVNNCVMPGSSLSSFSFSFTELSLEELVNLERSNTNFPISTSEKMGNKTPFRPLPYDKDDETMVSFIQNASNIRAENFFLFGMRICSPIEFYQAKKIAGAIHPALVTTTSVSASFQCFHLMQYIQQSKVGRPHYPFIKYNIGLKDLDIRYEMIQISGQGMHEINMSFFATISDLVQECSKLLPQMDSIFYGNSALYYPQAFTCHGEIQHLELYVKEYLALDVGNCVILNIFSESSEINALLYLINE